MSDIMPTDLYRICQLADTAPIMPNFPDSWRDLLAGRLWFSSLPEPLRAYLLKSVVLVTLEAQGAVRLQMGEIEIVDMGRLQQAAGLGQG